MNTRYDMRLVIAAIVCPLQVGLSVVISAMVVGATREVDQRWFDARDYILFAQVGVFITSLLTGAMLAWNAKRNPIEYDE